MWPFSRGAHFQLPPWNFQPVEVDTHQFNLASGKWIVTDGAYVTEDSIELGSLESQEGFLRVQNDDGLPAILTLRLMFSAHESLRSEMTFVIDSGDMILCNEKAFTEAGITLRDHKTSYALQRSVQKAHPGKFLVLINNTDNECLGIFATPRHGDGLYRLTFERENDCIAVHFQFGESC